MLFRGEYSFLSNFQRCWVNFEGARYPSVENAYQAAKFPSSQRSAFRSLQPGEAKRLGRMATLHSSWNEKRLSLMHDLLRSKFSDVGLNLKLQATGNIELVEENTWGDFFWGRCQGRGENHLGRLLMLVRAENRSR